MNQQLDDYIKKARSSGQTDAQIMQALLQSGWSQAQVNEAFGISNPQANATPPAPQIQSLNNEKVMAALSYFGILLIIPLMTDAKNNPFVKFHIKQGIVLLVAAVIVWVVAVMIPYLGIIIAPILNLLLLALLIIGVMNVINGKQSPLPVIGKLADNLKF